ncbi:phage tail protein [Campylobacter estrildidarum]|uniref:Phage tail fibre protein N-terminal domain-containing protein n=1 Tax=Campylobacter estrildidarum TaxID=2510189 RepID=A0A4U7BHI1_9BACT|nr:phage tail protein [Campylobacter estrildidarum]TKX29515.1 hypothetical protein CQA69_07385 [Campylobacter estrildidarum]
MNEFYTILTSIGLAKIIKARAEGKALILKSFKLSSAAIIPKENMKSLNEIVYEANINSRFVDENNPNHLILECVVGAEYGGFNINSIGLFDDEEELIGVGSVPFTYKPKLSEGAAKELIFEVIMELANVENLTIELDNTKALATKEYVENMKLTLMRPIVTNANSIIKLTNKELINIKEKK